MRIHYSNFIIVCFEKIISSILRTRIPLGEISFLFIRSQRRKIQEVFYCKIKFIYYFKTQSNYLQFREKKNIIENDL
jgi:hypothetical protein